MGSGAPGELELIRGFVNTLDVEEDRDDLADWLGTDSPAAVSEARGLREALRSILRAHHDDTRPPPDAVDTVNRFAADVGLVVCLDRAATPRLEPAEPENRWGQLLAALYRASLEGTWSRLKLCPADDCQWAFYDASKNRSRTWCSMEVCGNRAKARAYRERHHRSVVDPSHI